MFDFIKILQNFRAEKKLLDSSRNEIKLLQTDKLRSTLLNAFNNSAYWRKLFQAAEISETEINSNPLESLRKLPVVTKADLMDNFESALTQSGILRSDVEKFILSGHTGKELFKDQFLALNTSGSSGRQGIFLFSPEFLDQIALAVATRISPSLLQMLTRKTKVAFIGEASGHHSGFSLIQNLPENLFESISIDVSSSKQDFARKLNEFKPDYISGYPSGICVLAEAQIEGLLHINPEQIICSGEPLSELRYKQINEAFNVVPINFYACTECLALGMDSTGSGALELFDQVVFLEVLDDQNNPVATGQKGRVVITVLCNYIQPLIRYSLDDQIVLLNDNPASPWTLAETVAGRTLDKIHLKLSNREIIIHPMDLVGLFIPELKQYQIEQTSFSSVIFRLVAGNKEQVRSYVEAALPEFLNSLGIKPDEIQITLEFTDKISHNPKTGKTPIIIPLKQETGSNV